MQRSFDRGADALRPVRFQRRYTRHAEGSVLVEMGHTQVLCTASVEEKVPPFLKGKGQGWVTAEYGMLPRATNTRGSREAASGKQSGRTQEIQRLIGRSLRAVTDLARWASARSPSIATCCRPTAARAAPRSPAPWWRSPTRSRGCAARGSSPAIRCAISSPRCRSASSAGEPVLDLDYAEDSGCDTDMNVVMTGAGGFVEIQGTAESAPFTRDELSRLLDLAAKGISELISLQRKALAMLYPQITADEPSRHRFQ